MSLVAVVSLFVSLVSVVSLLLFSVFKSVFVSGSCVFFPSFVVGVFVFDEVVGGCGCGCGLNVLILLLKKMVAGIDSPTIFTNLFERVFFTQSTI